MVTARQILNVSDQIAKKFSPQKIILFGSYAYGKPNEDSDVDLMVVMNYRGPAPRKEAKIRLALDKTLSIDVFVKSAAQIRRRLAIEDFFIQDILEKGLVLYDASNVRVGQKGRRRLHQRLLHAPLAKDEPIGSDLLLEPTVR